MKKETTRTLDDEILDHADEIIRLMKLKGMKDRSDKDNYDDIAIWMMENEIQVDSVCQEIKTKKRLKK
jgi:hypothetical protein